MAVVVSVDDDDNVEVDLQAAAPYARLARVSEHPHCIWCGIELADSAARRDMGDGMFRCPDTSDAQRGCADREFDDEKR